MAGMLREALKDKGITQEQLAAEFGVRQSSVTKWVNNRVPAHRVLKLCELTGLKPSQLRPDVFGQ